MSSANGSNGSDWARLFAEFHARHRDVEGKKLVFTAVFNAAMEAFIGCPEVPLLWRVLAWVWRHSWGNDSDYCTDEIGGVALGQKACAERFNEDKQRINDCVTWLRDLHFVLDSTGHKLYPVDDPIRAASQTDSQGNSKSPLGAGLFKDFCEEWRVRYGPDFEDLQSAEATVNRIKKVRLGLWKKWRRDRTKNAPPDGIDHPGLLPTPQPSVSNSHPSSSSGCSSTEPPKNSTTTRDGADADTPERKTPTAITAPRPNTAEIGMVVGAMRRYSAADDEAAAQLIAACRANSPECSVTAICEAIEQKGPVAKQAKKSAVGMLLTAVPKLFAGEGGKLGPVAKAAAAGGGAREETLGQRAVRLRRSLSEIENHG